MQYLRARAKGTVDIIAEYISPIDIDSATSSAAKVETNRLTKNISTSAVVSNGILSAKVSLRILDTTARKFIS